VSQPKPFYLLGRVGSHAPHPGAAWSDQRTLLQEILPWELPSRIAALYFVVTQSLSLLENNYSTYPGKTLIFT